jgi:ubiquinone/menaquinone biosynthesis C-methylase UbiE
VPDRRALPPSDDALFPERFVPGEMHGLIEAEHLARYRWASAYTAGKRVLDAGCGTGYGSRLLLESGAASVTGVDIAPEAIDAASLQPTDGLSYVLGDLAALPLADASIEVAVCFEAIEHVQDQEAALDELRRVLVPEGLLIISSPNRDVYQEGNPHHTHEYTHEELRAVLDERFANVVLGAQQAWLASMICDEQVLTERDPTQRLQVEISKIAAVEIGSETFILALASDTQPPDQSALALLTSVEELSNWIARARSAEEHLARAQGDLREAEAGHGSADAAYASAAEAYAAIERSYNNALVALEANRSDAAHREVQLSRTSTLLAERNAALRLATIELQTMQRRNEELEQTLQAWSVSLAQLRGSLSWRLTAPLRVLTRGIRRS